MIVSRTHSQLTFAAHSFFSIILTPLLVADLPRVFFFGRVVLSLSHLHVTVAIANSLVRTAVKDNIFDQ